VVETGKDGRNDGANGGSSGKFAGGETNLFGMVVIGDVGSVDDGIDG